MPTTEVELPDFNDMYEIIEKIRGLVVAVEKLKNGIDGRKAEIVQMVISNEKYFVNGKPPSMALIERVYLVPSLDKQLKKDADRLIELEAALEKERKLLSLYHTFVEIWRTEQANKRMSVS